jgi:hypothetical protein
LKTMSHYGEESSRSCGDGCSMCCSKFWQSIPYATLVFHTVTLIGVIGFAVAGAQGTVALAGVPHLEHTVSIFGPTIAVVSGVSFFPLILTFIFAVYATGYIREVIKGHILTTCLGYSCSVFVSYFPIPLVFSVSFCYLFLFSSSPSFSYSSLLWCGCWFVLLWPLSSLSTWRSVWHVNRFWRDLD